jgi:hypothetical protein
LEAASFLHTLSLEIRRFPEGSGLLQGNECLVSSIVITPIFASIQVAVKVKVARVWSGTRLFVARGVAAVEKGAGNIDFGLRARRRRRALSMPWGHVYGSTFLPQRKVPVGD